MRLTASHRACEQVMIPSPRGEHGVEPSLRSPATLNDRNLDVPSAPERDVPISSPLANDVVTSLALQWDTAHPLHKGNSARSPTGADLFGPFLTPALRYQKIKFKIPGMIPWG
jgi:hypothetical protein